MLCSKKQLNVILVSLVIGLGSASASFGQTTGTAAGQATGNAAFSGYKGLAIGAATTAVREKLGNPKDKSDAMDLYVFSDSESVQFYYGPGQTVTAIMMTYSGDLKKAPTPRDVFGEDVAPKPDGGIFKMVRFPKAGYWISYNRTAGDDAIVSIAIQKI